MSDVVVSVTESTTSVTVTEQDVSVAVTETPVTVTTATVGLQGIPGANGSAATITAGSATVLASTALPTVTNTGTSSSAIFNFGIPAGSAGSAGVSGVISVTSPITNIGTSSSAILGINQSLLSITKSQVSDFTSGTVTYATTSGTATYATTSGSAVTITGSITKSQVSDFTSGTVAVSTSASTASTSGTAFYSTTSGTSVSISGSITKSQVSDFTSGTVAYASLSGIAVAVSGSAITVSQISDFASGTVANISGTVTQSQVTSLTSDLTGKASTSAPTITGFTTLQATPSIGTDTPVTVLGGTGQSVPLQSWKTVALVALSSVDQNGYGNFARVSAGQATDLAYSAALSVNTTGTATKGVVVRAVASQSSNIFEIQSSAASPQVYINSSYEFVTPTNVYANAILNNGGFWSFNNNGVGNIAARNATNIPLTLKGAASQSANLQEWQNSGGTVLARVNSAGLILGTELRTLTSYYKAVEANSGGVISLTKSSAAAGNEGSGIARIYVRDGTTAGTLKLVVRAGAAGAETTILDNIPQ